MNLHSPSHPDLLPGFTDPVRDSQATFRVVLDAMANPGRILQAPADLSPPAPLNPATTSVCLMLADYETPLFLDEAAGTPATAGFLRFHCGAQIVEDPAEAAIAIITGAAPAMSSFNRGSDAYPESGATLIIQCDALESGEGLDLRGPGIETATHVTITGPSTAFWDERARLNAAFPRGLDLILTHGDRVMAIPRTTSVTVTSGQ